MSFCHLLRTNFSLRPLLLWVYCSKSNLSTCMLIAGTFLKINPTNGPLWNSFSHLISKFINHFSEQFHTITTSFINFIITPQFNFHENSWSDFKVTITTASNLIRTLVVNALRFRNTLLLYLALIF